MGLSVEPHCISILKQAHVFLTGQVLLQMNDIMCNTSSLYLAIYLTRNARKEPLKLYADNKGPRHTALIRAFVSRWILFK